MIKMARRAWELRSIESVSPENSPHELNMSTRT